MADKITLSAELVGSFERQLRDFNRNFKTLQTEQTKVTLETAQKFLKANKETTEHVKKFSLGAEQLKKELKALLENTGKLSPELGKVTGQIGAMTAGAGTLIGVVAAVGAATAGAAAKLGDFSSSMVRLRQSAQQAGLTPYQLRIFIQASERFGDSAEEAEQSAVNFGAAITNIGANVDHVQQRIKNIGFGRELEPVLGALETGGTKAALAEVLKQIDRIKKETPGAFGEQRANVFGGFFGPLSQGQIRAGYSGLKEAADSAESIADELQLTPEKFEEIRKQSEDFHKAWWETKIIFAAFGTLLAGEILPTFNELLRDFNDMFKSDKAQEWARLFGQQISTDLRDLQAIVHGFEWLEAHTPEWLKALLKGRVGELATGGAAGPMIDVPGVGAVPSTAPGAGVTRPSVGGGGGGGAAPSGGGGGVPAAPGGGGGGGGGGGVPAAPGGGAPAAGAPAAGGPAGAIAPGAVTAVGGADPAAFIMHHTGGSGSIGGLQQTLRQRGLGVEYAMDREGNIQQIGGPGAANILPGWGLGKGLSNKNIVGMEVIAKSNRDVTAKQIQAAREFIQKNYPNTPIYGHGEVNPGHKEADEGMAIVNAIRADRASSSHGPAMIGPSTLGSVWGAGNQWYGDADAVRHARHAMDTNLHEKIEGSAKINVDVSSADSKRSNRQILHRISMPRARQMEPAAVGPQDAKPAPTERIRD